MSTPRPDGRTPSELRPLFFQPNFAQSASGSVLTSFGNTEVICAVTIQNDVPRWMKSQNVKGGWLTAEYSMLPYSTTPRKVRDITKNRLDGRSVEIQRLIGRSLRACVDLEALGERTIYIDCDVLRADGGTRTASITGAFVALSLAIKNLIKEGKLQKSPIITSLAAVSVGIYRGCRLLDLNYLEDKDATVDMNVVMTSEGKFVEIQTSGEEAVFSKDDHQVLLSLAEEGIQTLFSEQKKVITL